MANVISNNAYNTLGLEANSPLKVLYRRAKEITRLAEIGEISLSEDLGILKPERTPSKIENALNNISAPKNQLKEFFFWFENNDSLDEKAINYIKNNQIEEAIYLWKEKSDGDSIESLLRKKNLAVLLSVCLLKGHKIYLEESLSIWNELISSDKYWKSFEKVFKHINDSNDIDPNLFIQLREDAPKHLADVYLEANKSDNTAFIEFRKIFNTKGEAAEKNISSPAINAVSLVVNNLENMKLSDDGVLTKDEAIELSSLIKKIQEQLNKLIEYDLYNDPEVKIIRDRASEAIRNIILDIHNNLEETEKSIDLINIALAIAGTKTMESKLKEDLNILKEVMEQRVVLAPIDELVEKEDFKGAIKLIEKNQDRFKQDNNIYSYLESRLKSTVAMYAIMTSKAGWDAYGYKNWSLAEAKFMEAEKIAKKYLDIFDIDKESLDTYLKNIDARIALVNANNLELIDVISNEIRETAKENFPDKWEGLLIVSLVDSKTIPRGIKFIKQIQTANILYTLGWFTVWFYGIGIIFFIIGWLIKNDKN